MADYVDNYCERTDGSFWSEPLNAVSNVSFLIAAIVAWIQIRRVSRLTGQPAGELSALPLMILFIFVGSSLFHTTATRWGLALDSGSIGVYMVYFVAALVFAVSLTARTLDGPLCGRLPIGTHYIWHTLNGVVLYLVTYAAVIRWREVRQRAR